MYTTYYNNVLFYETPYGIRLRRRPQPLPYTHTHTLASTGIRRVYIIYINTRCVRDDNSVTSQGVSNPVDLRERWTAKRSSHTRALALDLGNVTSPASMTDVTSLGDFLEKHIYIHTARKVIVCVCVCGHIDFSTLGKKKINQNLSLTGFQPPKKETGFYVYFPSHFS